MKLTSDDIRKLLDLHLAEMSSRFGTLGYATPQSMKNDLDHLHELIAAWAEAWGEDPIQ